jgi:hypothetical protein
LQHERRGQPPGDVIIRDPSNGLGGRLGINRRERGAGNLADADGVDLGAGNALGDAVGDGLEPERFVARAEGPRRSPSGR